MTERSEKDPRLLADEEVRSFDLMGWQSVTRRLVDDRQARIEQADRDAATIAVLRDALTAALTEIPYDIIECGGSKCRLSVCASCWGDGAGPPDMSGFNAALSDPAPRADALLRMAAEARVVMAWMTSPSGLTSPPPIEAIHRMGDALDAWDGQPEP